MNVTRWLGKALLVTGGFRLGLSMAMVFPFLYGVMEVVGWEPNPIGILIFVLFSFGEPFFLMYLGNYLMEKEAGE